MWGVDKYVMLCINLQRLGAVLMTKSRPLANSLKQKNFAISRSANNKFCLCGA